MTPQDGAAWVTGASSGIGKAVALKLASEGWTVYATARRQESLDAVASEVKGSGEIIPAAGDVTDAARMSEIVDEITASKPLALAILNAGIYAPMRARDFSAQSAKQMFDVNLTGVTNALEPVLKTMLDAQNGHVALTASVAGYRGLPGAAPYSATKAGLIAMGEALAMDLIDENVRISVINPGFVETDATSVNEFEMPFLFGLCAKPQAGKTFKASASNAPSFDRRTGLFLLKSIKRKGPHHSHSDHFQRNRANPIKKR